MNNRDYSSSDYIHSRDSQYHLDHQSSNYKSRQLNAHLEANFYASYKGLITRFHNLLKAGYSGEDIQRQWQVYYDSLTESQKQRIWKIIQTDHYINNLGVIPNSTNIHTTSEQIDYSQMPVLKYIALGTVKILKKYKQKLQNVFHRLSGNQASRSQIKTPILSTTLTDGRVVASRPKRFSLGFQPPKTEDYPTYKDNGDFFQQILKSIAFGLTVGLIVLVVYQFNFFNDRLIQPFIKPSSINQSTPVIVLPQERFIDDPTWKVIIPRLGISPPVVSQVESYKSQNPTESPDSFEERMQDALELGVVHYPSTEFPGQRGSKNNSNVVIIGHSSGSFYVPGEFKDIFSHLRDLELGDLILVNYQRKQYVYKIYETKVVKPGRTEVLEKVAHNNSLTLITCDPPGSAAKRLIVVAQQISPIPSDNVEVEALTQKDNITLPGNSRGLLDIVFD
ncbi:MAG: class E sortase [Candidatus Saccharibacteria bacterium]|nr:class E sortase [Candidatus Saccharibacteria bacterium]